LAYRPGAWAGHQSKV